VFSLIDDFPFALLPPALLVLAWVVLRAAGRRTGLRFFLSGVGLSILCVPAGLLLAAAEPPCLNPRHETWACGISVPAATGLLGALLTAGCVVALLVLTAFFELFGLGPE